MLEAVVFFVHIFVMRYGLSNSFNMFCKMRSYLFVSKQLLVSASAAEAATNIRMLQFPYTRSFRRSCAHFERILANKKYPAAQLRACSSVRYDALVSAHKIKYLKREIGQQNLDELPYDIYIFTLFLSC